jgi:Holliday junction resolvase RusA-like endonuclease
VNGHTGHPAEPSGDRLQLVVDAAPVSLQSRRINKTNLTRAIQTALQRPQYLLTGEVSITIEWLIHERLRYETLVAPDVDNIVKVVLDALCGPAGVLVNDCQVQRIACSWIDTTKAKQTFVSGD